MFYVLLFFLVALRVPAGAEADHKARELHLAGSIVHDKDKIERAWRISKTPQIAASLTNAWLFEVGQEIDEELVGMPPFLRVLAEWEEMEPDNATVPCLREVFETNRESRFPDWDALLREIKFKRRIYFHYSQVRRNSLGFLLKRRGNTLKSWLFWLNNPPLRNVERVTRLAQYALLEGRFLVLLGRRQEGAERFEVARKITEMIRAEDDEVALRKCSLQRMLLQERILLALAKGNARKAEELTGEYRGKLKELERIRSSLAVLSNLHRELSRAYARAYAEIRPIGWWSTTSVDGEAMARLGKAIQEEGSKAVKQFWKYKMVQEEDFTEVLDDHLAVFQEKEVSRAAARKFVDFLRDQIDKDGPPAWIVPAFKRVKEAYKNAPALGTVELNEEKEKKFSYLVGALNFLLGGEEDEAETNRWIEAFKDGRARPYLLLAFVKRDVKEAVGAVIEEFHALSEEVAPTRLWDYALCLRLLTGKDFGLDAQKWLEWHVKREGN